MAALRRQGLSVEVPRSLVGRGLLWGGSSSLRQMCSCGGVCSPVFKGEDDRDTRSCQLCFLPKELLFSVSCAEDKRLLLRGGQQCPAQGGPGPAPSGHPIWPCPRGLCQPFPKQAGWEITALPQAGWLGDNPREMQ